MKTDVLIIGAGLSGLLLAKTLKKPSLILEKSKGLGGRIANRRIEDLGFDHGAPFLSDGPEIRNLLANFDTIKTKEGHFLQRGMTKLPKDLAKDLEIKKSIRVELIQKRDHGWHVKTDTGEEFDSSVLVITAPLPQALELLQKSSLPFPAELSSISYDKALMALVITKDGALPDKPLSPSLHSIHSMAGRGLHPRGFVVRMSPALSFEFFEKNDEEILQRLMEEFRSSFTTPPAIEYQELKKWRYVTPERSLPTPFAEVAPGLYLIGDGFISPDAQGAVQSSLALSKKLNLAF